MMKGDVSIRSFEGIRGVAALSVALYHFNGFLRDGGTIVNSFYLFVDLFFILSGFVIFRAYGERLSTRAQFGNFVTRRIGRLYPLHVFATIFFVVVVAASRLLKSAMIHVGFGAGLGGLGSEPFAFPTWSAIAINSLLLQGIGPFSHYTINGPSWSISTEFYAYLVLGLSVYFLKGRVLVVLLTIIACSGMGFAWYGSVYVDHCLQVSHCLDSHLDYAFPRCIASFILGAFAEWVASKLYWKRLLTISFVQLMAAVLAVCVMWKSISAPAWAFTTPLCFLLVVVALASDRGVLATALQTRPCQYLGKVSYSIYMVHAPLVFVGHITLKPIPFAAKLGVLAAYVLLVLLISALTFRFIETPGREFARKLSNQWFDPNIVPKDGMAKKSLSSAARS
ncbi:acyltransferase [Paraburkholderia sp. J7]|uniref:acyltransferase family protein n=1 Tax=Paraburkholderia sp. J7 TaxID=2805438 RepID=UPI002AB5F437|nr:acyltransferase [Paraburkholderia sp. J7]